MICCFDCNEFLFTGNSILFAVLILGLWGLLLTLFPEKYIKLINYLENKWS